MGSKTITNHIIQSFVLFILVLNELKSSLKLHFVKDDQTETFNHLISQNDETGFLLFKRLQNILFNTL